MNEQGTIDADIANELLVEEYKSVLSREANLNSEIMRFESYSYIALGAFYSWFFGSGLEIQVINSFLLIIPVLICIYSYQRINWRIRSIKICEEYVKKIEQLMHTQLNLSLEGYETFLYHSASKSFMRETYFLISTLISFLIFVSVFTQTLVDYRMSTIASAAI